jgi:hypothetical protein
MTTTPTVKIPASCDRYAYAYGWVSGCMSNVAIYIKQLENATDKEHRALLVECIMNQVESFKAMDDCLHKEETK